jgi:plastocyanin
MTTIAISYSDKGFAPTEASGNPGDTITVTNTAKDEISLSFSSPVTHTPLDGLTSPVTVAGVGGSVSGKVRTAASNHPITFTVGGAQSVVAINAAAHQVTASPTSLQPTSLEVNPGDDLVLYNESQTSSVTIDIESPVSDPFGSKIGMQAPLEAGGQVRGQVASAAAGKRIKLTVKGSTSVTSTVDVRSGDTDVATASVQQQSS